MALFWSILCNRTFQFQVEQKSYRCVNTFMFTVFISTLIGVATYFEVSTTEMTREEIEEELINANRTEYMEKLILYENVTLVNVHNDIFYHPTYSQIVRLLFNFMASQVDIKLEELL